MNYELMERQLVLHEGLRLEPYVDTEGNWTVGVGYNIDARGWDFLEETLQKRLRPRDGMIEKIRLTRDDAMAVLRADILRIEPIVISLLPEYQGADAVRQRVIVDMGFNMGRRALNFRRALEAFRLKQWSRCARELYQSKWANQVDDGEGGRFGRADRLAKMILTGEEPNDPEWLRFVLGERS